MRCSLFWWSKRNRWYILAIEQGKRRVVSCNTSDRAEAEKQLEQFRQQPWGRSGIKWSVNGLSRAEQNRLLAERAIAVLKSEPDRFNPLLSLKRSIGLLSALGRISNPDDLKMVASEVIQHRLRGRIAERFVIARRSREKTEFTFERELRRSVYQLIREFNVDPKLAASHLECIKWELEGKVGGKRNDCQQM